MAVRVIAGALQYGAMQRLGVSAIMRRCRCRGANRRADRFLARGHRSTTLQRQQQAYQHRKCLAHSTHHVTMNYTRDTRASWDTLAL